MSTTLLSREDAAAIAQKDYLNAKEFAESGDYKQALPLYRKAHFAGHAGASYELGLCYSSGLGVEANPKEALTYFKIGAQRGNSLSMWKLALIYRKGRCNQSVNLKLFAEWCLKAADNGLAKAQKEVGTCYKHAIDGFSYDFHKAVHYLNLAAAQDFQDGAYLSLCDLIGKYERKAAPEQNFYHTAYRRLCDLIERHNR